MAWLIVHMWFLLFLAFALGIAIGWWIWGIRSTQTYSPQMAAEDPVDVEQGSLTSDTKTRPTRMVGQATNKKENDDLTKIIGVDEDIEKALNRLGITHLYQIADWGPARIRWVEEKIGDDGRVERERWVSQARTLRMQDGPQT